MTRGETLFIDTNVFLAATVKNRPDHDDALSLLNTVRGAGFHLAISGQVIREYMVVATRPPEKALQELHTP